ncbi:MAG: cysteine desulfurase [Candidatus Omnitrophica bacterium]|nr:cysteine desulfurase [Candidatus Omnitrophota bacterium]
MSKLRIPDVRKQFPLLKEYIYFDNSATSLTPKVVIDSMNDYYLGYCANVERGAYRLAQRATQEYDLAREKIAKYLVNCQPQELIFTRNFTEGANMVAFALQNPLLDRIDEGFGYASPLIDNGKNANIVATAIEHHSNLMPWIRLSKALGVEFRTVSPTEEGLLTPEAFNSKVDKNTIFVAFQHVSNSIGTLHPAKQIIDTIKQINSKALIFVDGAQTVGHMPVDFNYLGCDFYAFSGHKGPLGPKGTGGLVVRKGLLERFHPFHLGGGTILDVTLEDYKLKNDHRQFDGGTPYIPGLIGLGTAAEFLEEKIGINRIREHELSLSERLLRGLQAIDNIEIYGPKGLEQRSGIVSFNIKGWLSHDVSLTLDEKWNILTRAGHHCCIPTMRFLNILDDYGGNVRISLHLYNTEEEIDTALTALRKLAG